MDITPELISRIEKFCLDTCRSFPIWAFKRCERETGVHIARVQKSIAAGRSTDARRLIQELQAMLDRWKGIPWKSLPPDVGRLPGESGKDYLNRCFVAGGYLTLTKSER